MRSGEKSSESRSYKNVEVDVGGRSYTGSFYVENGRVHVGGAYGSKDVALNSAAPKSIASRLLREIVTKRGRR